MRRAVTGVALAAIACSARPVPRCLPTPPAPPPADASTTRDVVADASVDEPADPPPTAPPPRVISLGGNPDTPTPTRPVAPASMGRVLADRPTLRWSTSYDDTIIELGRDRSLSPPTRVLRAHGDHLQLDRPLAPGVWFWRVRNLRRPTDRRPAGPVWYFVVRPRAGATDASWVPPSRGCDLNGDGRIDFVRDDLDGNHEGEPPLFELDFNLASATGLGPTRRVPVARYEESTCVGDLDGDGRAELALTSYERTLLLRGAVGGVNPSPLTIVEGAGVADVGDVNGDGYADLLSAGRLLPGGPTGPTEFVGDRMAPGFVVALGDVDGDGCADVGIQSGPDLRVFRGGREGLGAETFATVSLETDEYVLEGHDVTGDGRADVVLVRQDGPERPADDPRGDLRVRVFAGPRLDALTTFTVRDVSGDEAHWRAQATLLDEDGDGASDLVVLPAPESVYSPGTGREAVLVVAGGPAMGAAPPRRLALTMPSHAVDAKLRRPGDVDGDGRDDLGLQFDCGWPAWLEVFRGGAGPRRGPIRGITWGCGYLE